MHRETRTQKINRLSSRRYTKRALAVMLADSDEKLLRAQRDTDLAKRQAPAHGLTVASEHSGWRLTVYRHGNQLIEVTTKREETVQQLIALLPLEEATELQVLEAFAQVADDTARYQLPAPRGLVLDGPGAAEDRRYLARLKREYKLLVDEVWSADPEEYPKLWASAVRAARFARETAPELVTPQQLAAA